MISGLIVAMLEKVTWRRGINKQSRRVSGRVATKKLINEGYEVNDPKK